MQRHTKRLTSRHKHRPRCRIAHGWNWGYCSNNKVISLCTSLTIESLHLFFSSLLIYFFLFFLSPEFSFSFPNLFHRTLSIKHRYTNLQSGSLNFWSPSRGQRGLGRPARLGLSQVGFGPSFQYSFLSSSQNYVLYNSCAGTERILIIGLWSRKRIINKIISGSGFGIR